MIWRCALFAAGTILAACAAPSPASAPVETAWPSADARPPEPAGNPATPARIELGRRLFYDADLSFDGSMSCATCHEQKRGFTDRTATHPGIFGDPGERNVQTLANVGWFASLTWGGPYVDTLEHQALLPIQGLTPVEMGFAGKPEDALPQRLRDQACYPKLFALAFPERGGAISMDTITLALGAFERTLVSLNAPYDRYRRGEADALTPDAKRGAALFADRCQGCHAGPHFTDAGLPGMKPAAAFHVLAPPAPGETLKADTGLHRITQRTEDIYSFRTPGLRNVAVSGPYLHDGTATTLEAAIAHHYAAADRQGDARPRAPPSASETADLIAFLGALTDADFLSDPRLARPAASCPVPLDDQGAAAETSATRQHNSPGP